MVRDIVIVADLGAAGNLVRNILLTSDQVHWPRPDNRRNAILSQYKAVSLDQWLNVENKLRFWEPYYGVDLSNTIDVEQFDQRRQFSLPVVYLNHSAFYQSTEFLQLQPKVKTLYVAPVTGFGLDWQVRSYCEKKTIEKLHNFTFAHDAENQKQDFCKKHGEEAYYRLNIKNFKEIIDSRQKLFGVPDVALETLLEADAEKLSHTLGMLLGIDLDIEVVDRILKSWLALHWPLDQTNNWKYHD